MRRSLSIVGLTMLVACSGSSDDEPLVDPDAGRTTVDAGPVASDAGEADAGESGVDAGTADAGEADAGTPDAGENDAGTPDAGEAMFTFMSTAFADGAMVPDPFTCDGPGGFRHQNNPEIVWANPPRGTQAFVMIFDDPDARNFGHWAFFTADATVLRIPEGTSNTRALPAGVTELRSGDRRTGYVPNCPGGRTHTYRWRIWAVDDANLGVDGQSTFTELERAASTASLGMVQFTGLSNAGG